MIKYWLIGWIVFGLLGCSAAPVAKQASVSDKAQIDKALSNQQIFEDIWFAEQQYFRGNPEPAAWLYDRLAPEYPDSFKLEQFAIQAAFKANQGVIAQRNLRRLLNKLPFNVEDQETIQLLQSLLLISIAFNLQTEATQILDLLEPLIDDEGKRSLLTAIDEALQPIEDDPSLNFLRSQQLNNVWMDQVYVAALLRRKYTDELIQTLPQLIKRHSNHAFFHYEFAKQLYLTGYHQAAYQAAKPIQHSMEVQYQYLLFSIEMALGWSESAKLRLPKLGDTLYASNAYYRLALRNIERGRLEKALDELKAIQGDHLRFERATVLTEIYLSQGKRSEALSSLLSLLDQPERLSATQTANLSQLLYRLSDHSAALQLLDNGLLLYEASDVLYYQRALIFLNEAAYESAEQDLLMVLSLNDQHAEAYNTLGYLLTDRLERHDEALPLIQAALALSPEAPHILDSMGWVLFHLNRFEESERFLRKALSVRYDAEIAGHLSEVLLVTGQRTKAQDVWETLVLRFPDATIVREMRTRLGLE